MITLFEINALPTLKRNFSKHALCCRLIGNKGVFTQPDITGWTDALPQDATRFLSFKIFFLFDGYQVRSHSYRIKEAPSQSLLR